MAEWKSLNNQNMSSRKDFIKQSSILLGGAMLASTPFYSFAAQKSTKINILHTNDWHSRIEPFDKTDKNNPGMGGAEYRAALIKKIRQEEEHILLLDAGDIFQGTPYFNFYGGELEYKLMTEMGYDCVTLGNHDFDNGINGLVKQMPLAGFDFVNCNYSFNDTELEGKIQPHKIYHKGPIRIGVLGVGIELNGLVPEKSFGKIIYNNPIENANKTAAYLKDKKKCDLIICLSHLGNKYAGDKVSDETLAKQSKNIDLILGGHTHTFLPEPIIYKNVDNKNVIVNQVGWAGLKLGKIDFIFNAINNQLTLQKHQAINIGLFA
jgi:5'-nucleotidase